MSTTTLRRRILEQIALLLLAVILVAVWLAVWGPPHLAFADLMGRDAPWVSAMFVAAMLVLDVALFVGRRVRRNPGPVTPLSRATLWLGVASALSLFTGFLLGWIAVLAAPVGALTGAYVFVRELRARSGHDGGNLIGLTLCAGAIVFLLA